MKANPGGQIDSENIIGRNAVIVELWERLAQQSIVLTAERRMGKTTIVKQMVKEGGVNVFPIYRDLEKVVSPAEFVSNVLTDISVYQTGTKWVEGLFGKFTKNFAGWQIGNIIKIPETSTDRWKEILENAIEYVMKHPLAQTIWLAIAYCNKFNSKLAQRAIKANIRSQASKITSIVTSACYDGLILFELNDNGHSNSFCDCIVGVGFWTICLEGLGDNRV
jgi:hypothetical protein